MAWGSLIAGIAAAVFAVGGVVLAMIPGLGALLGFGAPVLGLLGIILGGVAVSRARQEGGESGLAIGGIVVSSIAFLMGLLVALTCGLCNACVTASLVSGKNRLRFTDGGVFLAPRPAGGDAGGEGTPPSLPEPGAWADPPEHEPRPAPGAPDAEAEGERDR